MPRMRTRRSVVLTLDYSWPYPSFRTRTAWPELTGSAEIFRFIARLPFDVAPHARDLVVGGDFFAPEHEVERVAQILARDGLRAVRPAVVELAPVNQAPRLVEDIDVRRAGGTIRL